LAGAITTAVARIDQALQKNPEAVGESRTEEERILIEAPFTVTFEIRELDYQVWVLTVKQHRHRSR
jgi:hypothetical protein